MVKKTLSSASDMPRSSWINALPPPWSYYARLARWDRPIGIWLLLFPCWWSVALVAAVQDQPISLSLLAKLSLGAIFMRGAGCTINDIIDRDIDRQVARTALRPLATGNLTLNQALFFLGFQLLLGLCILLSFKIEVVFLGLLALPLIGLYPFVKRWTQWPQAFLGIVFSWGVPMSWLAMGGEPTLTLALLYAACIFWVLGYDTIYAYQDKNDDSCINIGSAALALGSRGRTALMIIYGFFLGLLALTALLAKLGWPFWLVLGLAVILSYRYVLSVDFQNPADCLKKFRSNQWIGWIVFVAIIAGS